MERVTTGVRLRQIMQDRGLKQIDIVRLCAPYAKSYGISMSRSAISQYVSGRVVPAQRALSVLGKALNVSEAWLMGFDVDPDRAKAHPEEIPPITLTFTPHEVKLIIAYRNNPAMQPAVNRLLNIPDEEED